jgi:hypothetical protein
MGVRSEGRIKRKPLHRRRFKPESKNGGDEPPFSVLYIILY